MDANCPKCILLNIHKGILFYEIYFSENLKVSEKESTFILSDLTITKVGTSFNLIIDINAYQLQTD